jgi:hypothetical protein
LVIQVSAHKQLVIKLEGSFNKLASQVELVLLCLVKGYSNRSGSSYNNGINNATLASSLVKASQTNESNNNSFKVVVVVVV